MAQKFLFALSLSKRLVIFLIASFCLTTSRAQNSQTTELSEKVFEESKNYFEYQESNYIKVNQQEIELKFKHAEQYLKELLLQMVLVDTSTYYEEQTQRLKALEREHDMVLNKDQEIQEKFEQQYLLLSLLRVSTCGEYFEKLIELYFEQNLSRKVCDESDSFDFISTNDHKHCDLSDALFLYKTWLYDMLIARFKDEINGFSKSKSVSTYNWMTLIVHIPFDGNITKDEKQIEKIESWSIVALEGIHDSTYKSPTDLSSYLYLVRASKVSKWNSKIQIDSVYHYNEKLLIKSINLKDLNPEAEYNLGVLYYNRSSHLTKQSETIKDPEIANKLIEQASILRNKGTSLLEEARKRM